ncbi:13722_t:CDS:2 [Funneliformis geosporum]|uniref:10208_t:CDS:1 n=1 Tax=Funneliformis geosporum TaxID=1117311 RepID=A0A9W4SJP2_9GLOM|nr:13722_t:CDS:2 [Funneliformis geosporum]CAI2171871.1 10208_t:CDS:2 [Funneliformis geosporum]
MSKFKTVNRDVEDPILRPRPVSQEGYYYPAEHANDNNYLHPNSRRQPIRQYGSSASLEVRHEHNRQQREQEFFASSPSAARRQASAENLKNVPAMRSNVNDTGSSDYYQRSVIQTSNNHRSPSPSNTYLPPQNSRDFEGTGPNSYNSRGITPHFNNPPNHNSTQPKLSNNSRSISSQPKILDRPIRKDSYGSSSSQYSMNSQKPTSHADPFTSASPFQPSPDSHGTGQRQVNPGGHMNQSQSKDNNNNKSQHFNLPDPVSMEDYVSQAIKYHENNQLEKSTEYLRVATEKDSAVGMVLYGIALRHGWGCKINAALAFKYLEKAAASVMNLNDINKTVNLSSFRGELTLAIYELGVCFRHGWGIPKNKATAAYYFEIAANMGDPDAQNDVALCYYKGEGVKKDMKLAAKYYRMADAQGHGTMGNSWIFKDKYNDG